jgi:hypothetical protein
MTTEQTTTCPDCDLTYFYDPKHHRCEQAAPAVTTTWIEECMAKQWNISVEELRTR